MDPTQEGASGSVEDGAADILKLMDDESPPVDEEKAPAEEEVPTPEGETEKETEPTGTEEEEGEAIVSVSELAEANGWEVEDVLNLSIDVKVDGETQQTTLAEALKGFQLDSHLRNKDRDLSDKIRSATELSDKAQAQINERLSNLDSMVLAMEKQLVEDANDVDWKELKELDPEEYLMKKSEFTERATRVQEQRNSANDEQFKANSEYAKKQKEKLMTVPEFSTAEKFTAGTKAVADYLRTQGFSDEEIAGTVDHRAIQITLKAKLYDELLAKKPQTDKKVRNLPKVLKPGAKQSKGQILSKQQQQQMARLKKSGKQEDAAELMKDFL